MTELEARSRLEMMLASDVEPSLSGGEIANLMILSKRADSVGVAPTETGWVPTFDLNAAAAEGWRWKGGKWAPRYGATLDGETLHRQQVFAHCLKMADYYARRSVGTIQVRSAFTV